MKISTRIRLGTVLTSSIFVFLTIIIIFLNAQTAFSTQQLQVDTQPTLDSFEHLLLTVHEDNILLDEFLLTQDYVKAVSFRTPFDHNSELCSNLSRVVEENIILSKITEPRIINSFNEGMNNFEQLEQIRDEIIELHLEELATNNIKAIEKRALYSTYQKASSAANTEFLQSIDIINSNNNRLYRNVITNMQYMHYTLGLLLFVLLVTNIINSQFMIKMFATPIENMSQTFKLFSMGKYDKRIATTSSIEEIKILEKQSNTMLDVISEELKDATKRDKVQEKLLSSQYADVLTLIKQRKEEGKTTTMKDVKKAFHLTYPTVQNRVTYLEDNGYITIEKEGRDKHLYLLE